ncbi:MAG: hypothetical protein EOO65_01645 [Methanosarcinales archaeon]|nr:MAG: hypothetical protein EOO65_01645 [Methanosarcinales archaeon]
MDDGRELPTERSRRPDDELYIDTECTGRRTPSKRCVMARVAARVFPATPKCWNFNESINAVASCRAPSDGTLLPLCLEVGISQNALIVECAGDYPQCGTYLEVHRGTNRDVLSSVKLKSTFTSGYRMSLLSTTYKRNSSLTLCYDPVNGGQHEVRSALVASCALCRAFSLLPQQRFGCAQPPTRALLLTRARGGAGLVGASDFVCTCRAATHTVSRRVSAV